MRLTGSVALLLALGGPLAAARRRITPCPNPRRSCGRPPTPAHRPGFEAAQGNCMVCHSVDYIAMQPPRKGAGFWESEVTKMVKVYHAPVGEADAKAIAAYLAATY